MLRRRGHRVVFVVEESFAGTLEAKGFEERLMRLGPAPEEPEEPGQFWKDFIRDTAPVFRKSTLRAARRASSRRPGRRSLDGARYVDERLAEIFGELAPDVDRRGQRRARFPAIPASGRPWVRIVSCNPLEVKDPALPPTFSGLPLDDRSGWDDVPRRVRAPGRRELQAAFSEFCVERGAPPLPELELIHESPWLNLTLYPDELDYPRSRAARRRPGTTSQTSVRATDEPWSPPEVATATARSSTSASARSARPTWR